MTPRANGAEPIGPEHDESRLVIWGPGDLLQRLDEVIEVYGQAMGYPMDLLLSRRSYIASHVHRRDFRAGATLADDGRLLGFG